MMRGKYGIRKERGSQLAEFAAALTLAVPVFVVVMYMCYESCIYLYLKTGVDAAARTHARWLAINYNFLVAQNGNSAGNYASWKNSAIRVANCVISDTQFTNGSLNASGQFVTTAPPLLTTGGCISGARGQGQVAVQVLYPGPSGLPPWPNPPLSFFGVNLTPTNYTIAAVYVADIEP